MCEYAFCCVNKFEKLHDRVNLDFEEEQGKKMINGGDKDE